MASAVVVVAAICAARFFSPLTSPVKVFRMLDLSPLVRNLSAFYLADRSGRRGDSLCRGRGTLALKLRERLRRLGGLRHGRRSGRGRRRRGVCERGRGDGDARRCSRERDDCGEECLLEHCLLPLVGGSVPGSGSSTMRRSCSSSVKSGCGGCSDRLSLLANAPMTHLRPGCAPLSPAQVRLDRRYPRRRVTDGTHRGKRRPAQVFLLWQEPEAGPAAHRRSGRVHLRRVRRALQRDHRGAPRRGRRREPRASSTCRSRKRSSRFLEEYVIGQEAAKRALSVAVYNHYKRVRARGDAHVGRRASTTSRSPRATSC